MICICKLFTTTLICQVTPNNSKYSRFNIKAFITTSIPMKQIINLIPLCYHNVYYSNVWTKFIVYPLATKCTYYSIFFFHFSSSFNLTCSYMTIQHQKHYPTIYIYMYVRIRISGDNRTVKVDDDDINF